MRFGYKFWALCAVSGFCYNFDLYCGKSMQEGLHDNLSLGSSVVLQMLGVVDDPRSHSIYFDNLFPNSDLLMRLREMGFEATGTTRDNHLKRCPLKETALMKMEPRGSYDYRFDINNEILIVRWLDNKCVTIGTNYDSVEPICNVQCWRKVIKGKSNVSQPHVLSTHNNFIGGVHKPDRLVSKYATSVRGKKWYRSLFTRVINMTCKCMDYLQTDP
uniref:PiggyBac transposable element-derived protein domain-containing protein n=1 Tax=Octopus bimaculoides TaxID=37653 RepID=A0A0L8G4M5_OCTBM